MAFVFAGQWGPEALLDLTGRLYISTAFTVVQAGTQTAATLYADRTKALPQPNPGLISSVTGNAKFFADPGVYDITVAGIPVLPGIVVLPDKAEPVAAVSPAVITDAQVASGAAIAQAKIATLVSDLAARQPITTRTAAQWTSANPVLASGIEGVELDTGLRKMGDGTTAWTSLAYKVPVPSGTYAKPATSGLLSARPAATVVGQRYLATNTYGGSLYESLDGATWTAMGVAAARPDLGEGIYVPSNWGNLSWRAARLAAASRLVSVVGWGDSLTLGVGASNFKTKSWFGKLVTDLQALYGDGGSGYQSIARSVWWEPGLNPSIADVTMSANWTARGAANTGLTINNADSYSLTAGSTITFAGVRGTTITVYYVKNPAYGPFTVSVDGSVVGTVNSGVAAGFGSSSFTVAAGSHTVTLTTLSTSAVWIAGVSGTNATGIVGHNVGQGGAISNRWNSGVLTGLPAGWNAGYLSIQAFSPDLFICAHGVNDSQTTGQTADGLAYNTRKAMDYAKAWNNGATDCLIVVPHVGQWEALDGGVLKYQDMALRLRALGDAYGAAVADMWLRGRSSWDYWNSLGYWSDSTYTGGSGTNQVHPSDAGHAYMANSIEPILTAA